ncbi:MAG: sugar ABC transporter substrate-binding protein [Lachnospiraceae bacterium]|nr:sugar ABC transporter substrate-binding protein [Lachnospiraceae bacterium]
MKKRIVSVLLCMTMLSVMLAGCGGKSGSSDGGGNTGSGTDSGTDGTATASDDKPFAGEKLTVLYMSGVYADAAKSIVADFEAETGATVEVVDFPYTTLHEKALLDLTSGTGSYDIIDVASQWDGEFAPYMTDLGPMMEKDGYQTDVFIENVFANSGLWQGTTMGIPNASTPQLFAYRTDLLPDGLPDTWEEYRTAAKELTDPDSGMYGISVSATTGQLGGVFDYVLWSMGGAWADEGWNVTIDSPETRAALEHLKEIQDYSDPSILAWGVEESIKAFLDGNAAICETWPTLGLVQAADDETQSKVAGKWALSLIPHDKTGATLLSAWDVAIPAASKNQELAWEWIKMYTSEENQNKFYDEFGILSPRKTFWERDGIKGTYMDTVREALDTANMWWRVPASTEVDTMLNTVVSEYMSGQTDLETAVQKMKTGIEEALKNAPPEEGTKNYNL